MMILDSLLHPALIHRNYSYCMNLFGDYYGNERVEKTVGRQKKSQIKRSGQTLLISNTATCRDEVINYDIMFYVKM